MIAPLVLLVGDLRSLTLESTNKCPAVRYIQVNPRYSGRECRGYGYRCRMLEPVTNRTHIQETAGDRSINTTFPCSLPHHCRVQLRFHLQTRNVHRSGPPPPTRAMWDEFGGEIGDRKQQGRPRRCIRILSAHASNTTTI